jgi:hypothetical protein
MNSIFAELNEHGKAYLHVRPITETNKRKLKKLEKKDLERRFDQYEEVRYNVCILKNIDSMLYNTL